MPSPFVFRWALRLIRIVLAVYIVLVVLVACSQSRMLYFPTKLDEPTAVGEAKAEKLEPWRDSDNRIIGWHRPNPMAANRLVVFHGNAGYAVQRSYYVDAFQALDNGTLWEVFLFEYPGYGARTGSPGMESFISTAKVATETLLAADKRPLFLLGESIGSGTASALAGLLDNRVAGVVAVIPFERLVDVARDRFPFLPVSLILQDKFDNISALSHFLGPVVVAVAQNDEVIGAKHGRNLYEAITGRKLLIEFPGATHNTFPIGIDDPWFQKASKFLLENR